MTLPSSVAQAIDSYLQTADGAVPDLIEGLYVTGSLALGDYWPAISDIDLVAVCAGRRQNQSSTRSAVSTSRAIRASTSCT